jgi:DnaJ-class molecular chaperone
MFVSQVQKGWKPGTKVTFEGEGDEYTPGHAQDMVFVIHQKVRKHGRTMAGASAKTTV